jgi:hypothetical protein
MGPDQEDPRKEPGQRPRPRHPQCRGRGFESHHLRRKPRSGGLKWDPEGHEAPLSATSVVVVVVHANPLSSPKAVVTGRRLDVGCVRKCT